MIKPTVGRVVWYHDAYGTVNTQPCAAIIVFVHSDRYINLAWFDHTGKPHSATSVFLRQGNEPLPTGEYAEWMPYQLGQAAKTEELEKRVATGG